MKNVHKQLPTRLNKTSYRELRMEVLHRDGWQCQNCGGHERLQVHHRQFRSHGGADSQENFITLCASCHETLHGGGNLNSRTPD